MTDLQAEKSARFRADLMPHQVPPAGNWDEWLILAGRGAGKTRALCEWLRDRVFLGPGDGRWAIVGLTTHEAREVLVDGIMDVSPPWFTPTFVASRGTLVWPGGARGFVRGSDDPDRLLGMRFHGAICDEASRWGHFDEIFGMIQSGLFRTRREGWHARAAWSMDDSAESLALAEQYFSGPRSRISRSRTAP